VEIKNPRPSPPGNAAIEEKPRDHAHAAAGRDKRVCPHFDQALDQPVHGPLNFCAPNRELPDHMQEVVGQNPHLQPSPVGFKPQAAGLVPTESILALLNPVFHIPTGVGKTEAERKPRSQPTKSIYILDIGKFLGR